MRRLIIAGLLFLAPGLVCFSQKKNDLAAAGSFTLNPGDEKYDGKEKLPFRNIIVRDYRFDSTKLGYINNKVRKIVFRSTSSSEAFTTILNGYCSNILNPAAEKTMVIIIKSYWLQRGFYDVNADNNVRLNEFDLEDDQSGVCITDFEIFSLSGNEYKALVKLEYEFELASYKKRKMDGSFFIAFDSLLRKVHSMNVDEVLSGKKSFAWSVLHDNYNKRFDIPVLKNQETKRGVFLSFSDFKQNKTIYPDFRMRDGRLTDEVYVPSGNQEQLLINFWGFFDGKDYYIKIGHSFFKMIRQNNTFDLLGPQKATRHTYTNTSPLASPYGNNIPYSSNSVILEPRPLQLDMENGEVY
jgi:hypothetical protein